MSFTFEYPDISYNLATNSVIDISCNITNGTQPSGTIYTITPTPPIGININSTNGTIFGNTLFSSISPITTYVVDALSNNFITSATITFSVNVVPVFWYPETPYIKELLKDTSIVPIYLTSESFGTTYTILSSSPAYPSLTDLGLNLNFLNGHITGIPDISSNYTTYTIRANNGGVIYDASLVLSIQTLPKIVYPASSYTLTQGKSVNISPLPTNNPDILVSYNIYGCPSADVLYKLPYGLIFNTVTGEISGIPTVLTTYREYIISITNNIGTTTTTLILNVIKEFLAPPVLADNFSSNTFLTDPAIAMRRKAEILKYNKNSSKLSKQQYYSLLAQGKGPYAKRAYGNQGSMSSNPNTSGLPQSNNTIVCNSSSSTICSPTSSSDVPGPVTNLCYNPNVPLVGYLQPTRKKVNIGFKWPLQTGGSIYR